MIPHINATYNVYIYIYIYIYVYIHITGKSVAFFTSILLVFGCMKCSKSWILWSGKVSATCWSWSRSRSAVLRMTSDRLRNLLVILSFLILQISSWLPFLLFRSTTTSTPALVAAVASEVGRFAEIFLGAPWKRAIESPFQAHGVEGHKAKAPTKVLEIGGLKDFTSRENQNMGES